MPYDAAEFFHLLGLDFPASIKAVEAVGWFASGLGMYLFASRAMDKNAGLVAAIAYLFVPYHVVDMYVRGAMAEFLAFVFPPFILWAVFQTFSTRRVFYVPLLALFYGAMLMTHIQMTVLFSPVVAGYILVLWWEERRKTEDGGEKTKDARLVPNQPLRTRRETMPGLLGQPIVPSFLALLWGVAIAGVFFLPILAEQRYLTSDPLIGGFFNFRLHFLNPSRSSFRRFGGTGMQVLTGMTSFRSSWGSCRCFLGRSLCSPFDAAAG